MSSDDDSISNGLLIAKLLSNYFVFIVSTMWDVTKKKKNTTEQNFFINFNILILSAVAPNNNLIKTLGRSYILS